MRCKPLRAGFPGGVLLAAAVPLGLILLLSTGQATAAPEQDALIRAHIAAGEFAPAVALAQQAGEPRQRDAWLAEIAAAQAGAGDQQAAIRSAGEIGDDRVRSAALSQVTAVPLGGRGGGNEPDFESLINLITSTVAPGSWDTAGGAASIQGFPTGVYVDARGVLRPLLKDEATGELATLRTASGPRAGDGASASAEDARRASPLRMVSLTRLEKQIQLLQAAGRQPTEEMQVLAGLQRIQYVFVYPDTGDLVLAGPAGDWQTGPEQIVVGADTGQPVVRLDDLVVVLRRMTSAPAADFGCLIDPRPEGLARVKAFIAESSRRVLRAGERPQWLEKLRSQLGRQDVKVYGLDGGTRAARVMVEADYRMKLVGMGLEEGVPGVQSYLASISLPPGGAPPPMAVLRWWFTLNYQAVSAADDRLAFAIRGQGVKVESENERLSAAGQRIHTGESEELNRKFARGFTEHFPELCRKYPIYAELRNLFDLALACALIQEEGLADKAGWHMTCFGDPRAYAVERATVPKEVDTVINHRVVRGTTILAGISGGVRVHPAELVARGAMEINSTGSLARQRLSAAAAAPKRAGDRWWWD